MPFIDDELLWCPDADGRMVDMSAGGPGQEMTNNACDLSELDPLCNDSDDILRQLAEHPFELDSFFQEFNGVDVKVSDRRHSTIFAICLNNSQFLFLFYCFIKQEENNNSLSNDQSIDTNAYANHVLQNLTQNSQMNSIDANNDSLLALAVALRTGGNASPNMLHNNHLHSHLNGRHNGVTVDSTQRFVTNNSLEKLLSPNLSDLDQLTIGSVPSHRTNNHKGKLLLL